MNKTFLLVVVGVFLIGNISAFEFDNSLSYSDDKMTATITNAFGFGEQIGEAKLSSHKSVNEILYVPTGDSPVLFYQTDFSEECSLDEPEFTNMRTGEKINKEYYYAKAVYGEIKSTTYGSEKSGKFISHSNGSIEYDYRMKETTTTKEDIVSWEKIKDDKIPSGNHTIGIIVNVLPNEITDGVITLCGKKIGEHAIFSSLISNNQLAYYPLNESSGTIIEDRANGTNIRGLFNATHTEPGVFANGTDGIIGTSYYLDGSTTANFSINLSQMYNNTQKKMTIRFWMYLQDNTTDNAGFFSSDNGAGTANPGLSWRINNDATTTFRLVNQTDFTVLYTTGDKYTWQYYVLATDQAGVGNNSLWRGFQNGSLQMIANWTGKVGFNSNANVKYNFGFQSTITATSMEGRFDEIYVINDYWNASQIVADFNNGQGVTYGEVVDLNVFINSPANNTNFSTSNFVPINITGNATSNIVKNVSLFVNNVRNFTVTNGTGNSIELFVNFSFPDGKYNLTGKASDNDSNFVGTANTIITVDTLPPSINITNPEQNNSNSTDNFLDINFTISDLGLGLSSCWYSNDSYSVNKSLGAGGSCANITNITWSNGQHNVTVYVNDTLNQVNRTSVSFSIINPLINVTSPRQNFNYTISGNNITLNWSVYDANLQACWFSYNGINTTVSCGANSTGFNVTSYDPRNLTFYANDSLNNVASNFTNWSYSFFQNSITYNSEILEGSTESFTVNVTKDPLITIQTIDFIYNGTSYSSNFTSSGILASTINIPNADQDYTNNSFLFNIRLNGGQFINSTIYNQTVRILNMDNCTVGSTLIFNMTNRDEGNESILSNSSNVITEVALQLYSLDRSLNILNFSRTYSNQNPAKICLTSSLLAGANYSVDMVTKYQATNYAIEYYNLADFSLSNSTIPQQINLMDLFGADSTEFQLTFTGSNFLPVENALIYLDRQYVNQNGTFKTVELPKTDSSGQTILHMVRNDIIYNIRVVKNNEILGNFENLVAFCQDFTIGDCQITLSAASSTEAVYDYDSDTGIIYSAPSFNNSTNVLSFDFISSDGSAKNVTMNITRNDAFGNRTICYTSLQSASGTISCTINSNLEDTDLNVLIFVDNVLSLVTNVPLADSGMGAIGYLLMLILTMAFILMFSDTKTGILLGMGLSFVTSIGLGFLSGEVLGVGAAGIWIIVCIIIGIWKLNKDNPQ